MKKKEGEKSLERKLSISIAKTAELVQNNVELKETIEELVEVLEFIKGDIEWNHLSPTLRYINAKIKKAKS